MICFMSYVCLLVLDMRERERERGREEEEERGRETRSRERDREQDAMMKVAGNRVQRTMQIDKDRKPST